MGSLKRVLSLIRPYWKLVALAYTMLLLQQLLRLIPPLISAQVVNEVLPGRDMPLLLQLCGILIGLTAFRGVLMYIRGITFERISQNVVYDLRTGMYRHMQEMSGVFYDEHHIGEIMSRMTGDIEGVRNLVMNGGLSMVENLLLFIMAIVGMGMMSWHLVLVVLVLCPAIAYAAWNFNRKIRPAFTAVREQNAVLNTKTQENIAGVRVVKAFAREEYEKDTFSTENLKVRDANLEVTRIWSTYFPLMNLMGGLATPLVLMAGGILVATGQMSVGALVGAMGYVWMFVAPMRQAASFVNIITNGLVSTEKLFYYLDLGARIRNPEKPIEPEKREGRVDLEHVTFKYGDLTVLRDLTLHVKPGQTVAVMGATGSGKTTLTQMLSRAYDISEGAVKVDGVDIRSQNLTQLRKSIGAVMQETFLYSESIFENIRFGRPDATAEEVYAAARVAAAEEFIQEMPAGYDTVVGERGLGLSGGQKQRIALARAILYDPKILILDDATSAIDMETEAEIQKALRSVMKDRTTFVIAHRISSVRKADMIIVLKDGTIAEQGTHEELLKLDGLYAGMYSDQTRDFFGGGES